jgi:hypothetical protein
MRLTKHEQFVLCLVTTLLLTGWAVKAFRETRASHNPVVAGLQR